MPGRGKKTVFVDRSIKKKKETILIEVPKDAEIGEYIDGFEAVSYTHLTLPTSDLV